MKKLLKKLANKVMIRLIGHIPFPEVHDYKIVEKEIDLIAFYLGNVNPVNNWS